MPSRPTPFCASVQGTTPLCHTTVPEAEKVHCIPYPELTQSQAGYNWAPNTQILANIADQSFLSGAQGEWDLKPIPVRWATEAFATAPTVPTFTPSNGILHRTMCFPLDHGVYDLREVYPDFENSQFTDTVNPVCRITGGRHTISNELETAASADGGTARTEEHEYFALIEPCPTRYGSVIKYKDGIYTVKRPDLLCVTGIREQEYETMFQSKAAAGHFGATSQSMTSRNDQTGIREFAKFPNIANVVIDSLPAINKSWLDHSITSRKAAVSNAGTD